MASFTSKLSDTVSSEIGKVRGGGGASEERGEREERGGGRGKGGREGEGGKWEGRDWGG